MSNEYATSVIDAYLKANEQIVPHALFVGGPWGCGKTYFLEKIYEPRRQKNARANREAITPLLFVSLFGVASSDDVLRRIYEAASPGEVLIGNVAGTIIDGIAEFIKIKDAASRAKRSAFKKAASRINDYIFVFDDLERIEKGALGEVMGFVNSLITTRNTKVIRNYPGPCAGRVSLIPWQDGA